MLKLAHQALDRRQRPQERRRLERLARRPPRTDSPTHLLLGDINQSHALFQPRYDSIVFAPGRSEAHIAQLARIAKSGSDLDPLKVAALGDDWYLVDGHHRLQAYLQAERAKPIPVKVLKSDLLGTDRINWAVRESAVDNKKNRLSMSETDKMDASWASVARDDGLSIRGTAELFGISPRSVATMRGAAQSLRDGSVSLAQIHSWSQAKREAKLLAGGEGNGGDFDHEAKRRRLAARNLKGAMQMNLPPRLLAEVLESYSPGIVESMMLALKIEREDDEGEDM